MSKKKKKHKNLKHSAKASAYSYTNSKSRSYSVDSQEINKIAFQVFGGLVYNCDIIDIP